MPKMKTHSGAKKRFRLNASGGVKCSGTRKSTPRKMSNAQRRVARAGTRLEGADAQNVRRMLGV